MLKYKFEQLKDRVRNRFLEEEGNVFVILTRNQQMVLSCVERSNLSVRDKLVLWSTVSTFSLGIAIIL